MNPTHTIDMFMPSSRCGYNGTLGLSDCVCLFLDIASEHAEMLQLGGDEMAANNCYWVCAKTRVHFNRMPKICEKVALTTWPEPQDRISANRDYELTDSEGNVLAAGKTQWVIVNTETGRMMPTDSIYPDGLIPLEKKACPEPFSRIRDKFDDDAIKTYTVLSTDIDINRHMNNAKYFTAFFSLFSISEIEAMNVRTMEVQYKNPCYEGDVLHFFKRDTEDGGAEYKAALADGKTIALYRVN